MADYILESRVWLARPRAEVFAFFTESSNLALITPASFRLRVVDGPRALSTGAVVDLRLSWLGVPMRWRAFVREWDPPYRFIDVQLQGPCACWEHRHRFLEERGGTWVDDRVTYRLRSGPLGAPRTPCSCVGSSSRCGGTERGGSASWWTDQLAGRLMPSFSRRGRTRSVSRPSRARLATIEPCMSRLKYLRNGA